MLNTSQEGQKRNGERRRAPTKTKIEKKKRGKSLTALMTSSTPLIVIVTALALLPFPSIAFCKLLSANLACSGCSWTNA